MTSIVIGVETNQIAVQYTSEYFVSDGENTVDLATGEWGVEEESELDVALGVSNLFSEHGRKQHEMVIVNPDKIIVLHVLGNGLGEQAVRFTVGVPGRLVKRNLTGVVVE